MAGQYYYGPGAGEGLAQGVKAGFDAYDAQRRRGLQDEEAERQRQAEQRQQAAEGRAQEEFNQKKKLWPEQERRMALDTQNSEITRDAGLLGLSQAQMGLQTTAQNNAYQQREQEHKESLWPTETSEAQSKADKARADADEAQNDARYNSLSNAKVYLEAGLFDQARDIWNKAHPDDPVDRIDGHPSQPGTFILKEKDGDVHVYTLNQINKVLGDYQTQKSLKSERGQKIAGLRRRGFDQATAEDITDGRVRMTAPNQFGDVFLVNVADGTGRRVNVRQYSGAGAPDDSGSVTVPDGPVQPPIAFGSNPRMGLNLDAAAAEGTGPFAAIRQSLNNTLGVFMTGQPFPQTEAARNTLRLFGQEVKQSLVNSDRFPVHEQKLVEGMLPSPDRIFTDPDGERQKLVQLHQFLAEKKSQNERNLQGGRITMKDRGILMDQNAAIDRTLGIMGPISSQQNGDYGLPAQGQGIARPQSQSDYQQLPPGAQYMAPDGTVRTKR